MSAKLPTLRKRFLRNVGSGYPLTINILVTLLLVLLPLGAVSDVTAHTVLTPHKLLLLAVLSGVLLLIFHAAGVTRWGKWRQLCCLAVQCGLISAMQTVVPSSVMGYLFLTVVLQAVYLFGVVIAVIVAGSIWVIWSATAIFVMHNWLDWAGANIYACFLIVAVTLAAAVYTAQYRLKAQTDGLIQRLQAQFAREATPEQIQQDATMEERHRLVQTISHELRVALGRLEQTVSGAIVQAQASVIQAQPLIMQTQGYVRETVDSLRTTLKTLRPVPIDGDEQASSVSAYRAAPLAESGALLGVPLVMTRMGRVIGWLPLLFSCLVPLWVFFDGQLVSLMSGKIILLWLLLVACYLFTRWRWSGPWFQIGLAGQACTLLGIVLVTQSSALLIGLAVIAGQIALRCSWVQVVAGLLALQGIVALAVGLLHLTFWQISASVVLVGMIGTALVFPILSARRRFGKRQTAVALLHTLDGEIAALKVRADELRQTAVVAERRRVAREIHDGLGHYLMTIALQSRVAQDLLIDDPPAALRQLHATHLLIAEAQHHLVSAFDALEPTPLAGLSLDQALDALAQQHNQSSGGEVHLHWEGVFDDLPNDIALAFFRAAQEGLTNAIRHGQATHIAMTLVRWPSLVQLLIEDNGSNAGKATGGAGMGLQGLRERAALLGGYCEAVAHANGFTLLFEIPLTWAQS